MTATEAKRSIYRKCMHCKFYSCGVYYINGEPLDDFGMCMQHGYAYKDGEEDACRSFDYAKWAVSKAIRESEAK